MAKGSVVFLFDENTPPRVALSLRALGQAAFHVDDVGLKAASDVSVLRYAGERGWCFVSHDLTILHRSHERASLSEHAVGVFFLNPTIRGTCRIARTIYRHWPEMKRIAAAEPRPFLHLIRETTISRMRRRRLG